MKYLRKLLSSRHTGGEKLFPPIIVLAFTPVISFGRSMLILIIWWATILLEFALLLRIFKNGVLRAQPIFGVYLACVLTSSVSGYPVYETNPPLYRYWYWGWEFVCVLAGYCVVLEVLEKSSAVHEGLRRLARNTGLTVLAMIVAFTASQLILARGVSATRTSAEVERNLRTAELVLLALIILVIRYYGIRVGRNVKGVMVGYGLVVAAIAVDNALRSYVGARFQAVFSSIRSHSYLFALLVWTAALWSYDPNPVSQTPGPSSADYDSLTKITKDTLSGIRENVGKATGS